MLKILLPVDGSDHSAQAVASFIKGLDWYKETPEIHVINIQSSLDGSVSLFVDQNDIKQYHQEQGLHCLQNARDLLEKADLHYQFHIVVGDPATLIVQFALENQFDLVVLGPRGYGAVKSLLLGSVANKVMQLSSIPVLLVK